VSAFVQHAAHIHRRPAAHSRGEDRALAPVSFHSVLPSAALISTDDLGAASYISPPP
jgi:hypothetical protein